MSKGKEKMKATWNEDTTKLLIDLFLKANDSGHRKGCSFNKQGWIEITKGYEEQTGTNYDRMQFKNKYDALRKEWQLWDKLLHETGVGWDNVKNTVTADDDWWERKKPAGYIKFRHKGLRYHEELTRLFSNVAATGSQHWAPSSKKLPPEVTPECDMEEGSGDSDEVHDLTTGLSNEMDSFTVNRNSGGNVGGSDGGNDGEQNEKGNSTSGGDKTSGGSRLTQSLGIRRKGTGMKKKGTPSEKLADAISRIADTNDRDAELIDKLTTEANANRMATDARAYEISIAGVMEHLHQIPEIVGDADFYTRCTHLIMSNPPAREMYAAVKNMRENLLWFLKHECYHSE